MRKTVSVSCIVSVLLLAGATALAETPPIQVAECGRVERRVFPSPEMADSVTVDIWLPQEYDDRPGDSYPVIYMHDGQNIFDASTTWNHQSWEMDTAVCALEARGLIAAPPIIVGIHSDPATRVADLMPQRAVAGHGMEETLASVAPPDTPVRGDAYAAFEALTLKPAVDSLYRTLPDRAHTTVMGSSMGGLMSIYTLCEYPGLFGNAVCLSTHWVGTPEVADEFAAAMYDYLDSHLPAADAEMPHKLYFDHGTESIDALYGPAEERVLRLVRSKGYGEGTLLDTVADGASHNADAWARRVAIPLTFVLGK